MQKLLVATRRGQGQRPGDFTHAIDGELVYLGMIYDRDRNDPDGGCGCGRAFIGLNSHAGTTTAEVRELDLSDEDLHMAISSSLEQAGWDAEDVDDVLDELTELAAEWPVGTVVERRLDEVSVRQIQP